ncbi:MAG TPA: MBL fold metallo-hydrolase [Clostridia bacterium]|jgi:L-ascorbate metabolism protein UlaG (beta-lactamase superfamily)|nr:MBL fold metallo-hydrolase [Clostridia bacterium]
MIISWLGHSSFLITDSEGTRVLTDPYGSYVGREMTRVDTDVVILSHSHKDHSALDKAGTYQKIIDTAGEFCYNKIKFEAFYRYHDNKGGTLRGKTLITRIHSDGLTVCHMGDIGEDVSDEIIREIGHVDVLLIPIGGTYTINAQEAKKYVDRINPSIVIPMHYKNMYCVFDIDRADSFIAQFAKNQIIQSGENQLNITEELLTGDTKIILMRIA